MLSATLLGRPRWTNITRALVNVSPQLSRGDGTRSPPSLLLPARKAMTSQRLSTLSLRSVMSMSFCSIRTGTLNVSLVMPGLPGLTSVGPGTASSRANRLLSEVSRGTSVLNSQPGNRLK